MATKILLAEDDPALLKILTLKLTSNGFEVITVTTGTALINEFHSHKFDLIITDLIMPDMNGFEALEIINAKKHKTPILVLSNLGQKEDVDKAIGLGATEFLTKSNVSLNEIIDKVKTMTS